MSEFLSASLSHGIRAPRATPGLKPPASLKALEEVSFVATWEPTAPVEFTVSLTTGEIRQMIADGRIIPDDPKAFEDGLQAVEATSRG